MSRDEIKVSKKAINATIIALVLLTGLIFSWKEFSIPSTDQPQNDNEIASPLTAGSEEKFNLLSGQGGERSVGST